jgi:hypothetical protein
VFNFEQNLLLGPNRERTLLPGRVFHVHWWQRNLQRSSNDTPGQGEDAWNAVDLPIEVRLSGKRPDPFHFVNCRRPKARNEMQHLLEFSEGRTSGGPAFAQVRTLSGAAATDS